MKIRHIYWFAYFNAEEPSVRYRGTYALEYLQQHHGITYNIVYPGYTWPQILCFLSVYLNALLFRKKNSIIVFQKTYTNGIYTKALRFLLFCRPQHTIYDIDDAEHTRHPTRHIHHFLRNCSACAVGSQALIDYVRPFNGKVHLLTSPLIAHACSREEAPIHQPLRIVWIGYFGAHLPSLEKLIFPALMKIENAVELIVLGVSNEAEQAQLKAIFANYPQVQIKAPLIRKWLDEQAIYAQIAEGDIGIAPLLDTEFNRAKSAFKLKQCLSVGLPVLASPVGENIRFIEEGKNGWLCADVEDFGQKIAHFQNMNASEYQLMQQAAQKTVKHFDMKHYSECFLKIFNP